MKPSEFLLDGKSSAYCPGKQISREKPCRFVTNPDASLLPYSVVWISCTMCSVWLSNLAIRATGQTIDLIPHYNRHVPTQEDTHIIINTSGCSSLLTYAGSGWYAEPDIPRSRRLTAHVWRCSSEEWSRAAEWRTTQTLTCSAGWCYCFLWGQSKFHKQPSTEGWTCFSQHLFLKVSKVKVLLLYWKRVNIETSGVWLLHTYVSSSVWNMKSKSDK